MHGVLRANLFSCHHARLHSVGILPLSFVAPKRRRQFIPGSSRGFQGEEEAEVNQEFIGQKSDRHEIIDSINSAQSLSHLMTLVDELAAANGESMIMRDPVVMTPLLVKAAHLAREFQGGVSSISSMLQFMLPASKASIHRATWTQLERQSWAVATLGLSIQPNPGPSGSQSPALDVGSWAEQLAEHASQSLGFRDVDLSFRSLSLILWSLAKMKFKPRKRWLKNSRRALLRLSPSATSQEISLAFWAQATFEHPPTEVWTRQVMYHLSLRMVLYNEDETRQGYTKIPSNSTAALASDAEKLVRPVLLNCLADPSLYSKPDSSTGILPLLMAWFLELQYRALSHLTHGGMTAQQLAMCLYSLALISFRPSDKVMGAFYSGSGALIARQCLVDIHVLGLCGIGRAMDASQSQKQWEDNPRKKTSRRHSSDQYQLWQQLQRDPDCAAFNEDEWISILSLLQVSQKQLYRDSQGESIASKSKGQSHVFIHPRDLSSVLISLARIQQTPPTWWMRLYEAFLLPRINLLSLKQMIALLYGYGALRRKPPRIIARNVMQLVRGRWRRVDPKAASNLLVALARLKIRPQRSWVQGLLRQALLDERKVATLTLEGATKILWAVKKMEIEPGSAISALLQQKLQL